MVTTYHPETLEAALKIRKEKHAIPLAGGTDLMVRFRSWAGTEPDFPWPVMFINHLKEIRFIDVQPKEIRIGAGTTLSEVENCSDVPKVLRLAVSQMAAPALRNLGTVAGNICNASPAGDTISVLYALNARVELTSLHGSRELSLMEFITGPGRKDLEDDELLTSIMVPVERFTHTLYRKVGTRKANALSKLSFCGLASIKAGRIDDIRLSFGAVGPTVVRSVESEKKFIGLSIEKLKELYSEIRPDYVAMVQPIDDQRSTAVYRKQVSLNLLDQYIESLIMEN